LHGGCQQKLQPGRQHPVHAQGLQQHRQHKRQGEDDGEDEVPALAVVALALVGFLNRRVLLQAGAVARFVDSGDQCRGVDLLEHFDVCAFVGEVDGGVLHARDFAQGALDTTRATGAGHAGNRQVERF
jgi:hypothetical protein